MSHAQKYLHQIGTSARNKLEIPVPYLSLELKGAVKLVALGALQWRHCGANNNSHMYI